MDPRKLQFLIAVVGIDGARALSKAVERAEELDQAIFPRTILAWLDTVASKGHEGRVPGVNVPFAFKKSESGFTGSIAVNGELHRFQAASINHLAGCVAVALGFDHERVSPLAKSEHLAKLGKSIDLLVKTQLVKKEIGTEPSTLDPDVGETHQDPRGLTVYRVQNAKGIGAYRGPGFVHAMRHGLLTSHDVASEGTSLHGIVSPESAHVDHNRDWTTQPVPKHDFKNDEWAGLPNEDKQKLHFGFESPAHAREWFGNDALGEMGKLGWQLQPVRAKQMWRSKSGRQVVFLPHESDPLLNKNGDVWEAFNKAALPSQKKKLTLPGVAAAPIAPKQPIAPVQVQPANQKQAPVGAAGTSQAISLPKMPKSTAPKKAASVTKSESTKKCPHCMRSQFDGDRFKGCFCYAALSKSVKVVPTATGYTLQFGAQWDQDAILSLLETFKGKR